MTGAYEAVFSDDIEMFRPANIKQFDAICFNNTLGVLFDDPELRASLLGFVESGKGFVGIHDAIATFVQYPKYDQWPEFGRMLGGTENGGHPWNGEVMTMQGRGSQQPDQRRVRGQGVSDCRPGVSASGARSSRPPARAAEDRRREVRPAAPHSARPAKRTWTFPMSWIRRQGKGRVFYSGLGHGPDVFSNPANAAAPAGRHPVCARRSRGRRRAQVAVERPDRQPKTPIGSRKQ